MLNVCACMCAVLLLLPCGLCPPTERERERVCCCYCLLVPIFLSTDGEVEQEGDVDGDGQCRGDGEQGHEDGGVLRVHRVGAEQGRAQPGGMAWLPCSGRGAVAAAPDGARSCC